jgi:hypothetical protein
MEPTLTTLIAIVAPALLGVAALPLVRRRRRGAMPRIRTGFERGGTARRISRGTALALLLAATAQGAPDDEPSLGDMAQCADC